MITRRASGADLPTIRALLETAALTPLGAEAAFEHGAVIEDSGAIVAAAAVEPYGTAGLLRSVVVDAARRGEGLGRRVVAAAETIAADGGVHELYLLTETAGAWFPRLGYELVARDRVPPAVRTSVEFTEACATSALVMHRRLGTGSGPRGRPTGA